MREAGSALVGGLHGEFGGDAHPLPRAGLQVEPVRLGAATAETVFVVRTEGFAGLWSVGVPDRSHRTGGGCQTFR
ncbi:hypothetical protein GCM10020227_24970 [Streptomyces flavovirens]